MKALLLGCGKVLLVLALAVVVVHLWPITVVPLAAALVLVTILGALLALGLVAAGAVGVAAAAGLMAAAIALLGVLSPVWIPVLVIAGIIWLVRKLGGSGRQPAASA